MTNSWINWDQRQRCTPVVFERPADTEQLKGVLTRAGSAGHTVRVAGAGHSFTDLVLSDDTLISLDRMNRVLDVDRASGLVRVEAGIRLSALNEELSRHSLALENLGDIDVQSIAGATATGTHGTGLKLRNLSSQLHSLELQLADGSTLEVSEHSDPQGLRAARVSLGALGVISAVTLRTVPAFTLRGIDRPMPLEEALTRLPELARDNEHFEFYTFPYSPLALTRTNNRTSEPPRGRSRASSYLNDILLVNHALRAFCVLGRRFPILIPQINRLVSRLAGTSKRVDVSHRIFCSPRLVRFTEMEYAIPREHAAEAVRAIRASVESQRLEISFPIEVRFVAPDDAFLSPAAGRETCYIAVHVFEGMRWEPYFRQVERIMNEFDGRPHWGKRHFQTAATLSARYPDWESFQAVRARLDPHGRFTSAAIERVLGPAPMS